MLRLINFLAVLHCTQTRIFHLNDLQLKQMLCLSVLKHFTKLNTNLFFHSAGKKMFDIVTHITEQCEKWKQMFLI